MTDKQQWYVREDETGLFDGAKEAAKQAVRESHQGRLGNG